MSSSDIRHNFWCSIFCVDSSTKLFVFFFSVIILLYLDFETWAFAQVSKCYYYYYFETQALNARVSKCRLWDWSERSSLEVLLLLLWDSSLERSSLKVSLILLFRLWDLSERSSLKVLLLLLLWDSSLKVSLLLLLLWDSSLERSSLKVSLIWLLWDLSENSSLKV